MDEISETMSLEPQEIFPLCVDLPQAFIVVTSKPGKVTSMCVWAILPWRMRHR